MTGEPNTAGPRVGDRVEVRITGTVVQRSGDQRPMLHVELDNDLVNVADDGRVITYEHAERAELLVRTLGAPSTDGGAGTAG